MYGKALLTLMLSSFALALYARPILFEIPQFWFIMIFVFAQSGIHVAMDRDDEKANYLALIGFGMFSIAQAFAITIIAIALDQSEQIDHYVVMAYVLASASFISFRMADRASDDGGDVIASRIPLMHESRDDEYEKRNVDGCV